MTFEQIKLMLREDIILEFLSMISSDNGYLIYIYPEPYGNPSFHVKFKNEWEVVLQIKDFVILETKFGKYAKGTRLPKWIEKDIKLILNKFQGKVTKWEFMLMTWNSNNPNYQVDLTTSIP